MRRVIGLDIHRTFAEAVIWEEGRLRHAGRVDMTRNGPGGLRQEPEGDRRGRHRGHRQRQATVAGALAPFVARVVIANPLQVKAIAHAHVKTDKIDEGVLAMIVLDTNVISELMRPQPEPRAPGAADPGPCYDDDHVSRDRRRLGPDA